MLITKRPITGPRRRRVAARPVAARQAQGFENKPRRGAWGRSGGREAGGTAVKNGGHHGREEGQEGERRQGGQEGAQAGAFKQARTINQEAPFKQARPINQKAPFKQGRPPLLPYTNLMVSMTCAPTWSLRRRTRVARPENNSCRTTEEVKRT